MDYRFEIYRKRIRFNKKLKGDGYIYFEINDKSICKFSKDTSQEKVDVLEKELKALIQDYKSDSISYSSFIEVLIDRWCEYPGTKFYTEEYARLKNECEEKLSKFENKFVEKPHM